MEIGFKKIGCRCHRNLFLFLGQEAVTGSDTTETSRTVTPPKGPGKEVCTNKTETTFGLWCYDCQQNFAKVYDPENAVCLFDLSQVALRQCGPRDKYCKVRGMLY